MPPCTFSPVLGRRFSSEYTELQKMMEMTAIGMGLMMTGVAVAVGGLVLEAMFLMLSRSLRVPLLAASIEPAAIHLS